nr:alpha-ketoglutarate-dependent dioxygenase alkB homolog 6 [Leptinotarsa decemlineata]
MDLTQFEVKGVPPTVYYIPNFITNDEEAFLLKNIYSVPKPKWTCLSNRRLQDYGGIPHEKGMIPEKIPTWLQTYMHKVDNLHIFNDKKSNQVLINEYLPGQGIMPHSDGPLFYPTIATITCGSHTVLEFMENDEKRVNVCNILLERCSLVIIKEDMYFKYLHSISEREVDNIGSCSNITPADKLELKRSTRVSVTIRNVPKVLKIKFW